jgi:hypothetical protein
MSFPPPSVLTNLVGECKAANATPSHSSNEKPTTATGSTPDPQPSGGTAVLDSVLKSSGGRGRGVLKVKLNHYLYFNKQTF